MITTTIDTAELDFMLNGVKNSLIGSGGDISELTKDESRLLALQLTKLNYPRSRPALADKIAKNVSSRFALLDIDNSKSEHGLGIGNNGEGNTSWYAADRNFLYGSDSEAKDYRKASGDQVRDAFYSSKVSNGKARLVYGFTKSHRQHQRVAILRRIMVSKASLNRGIKAVQLSIGKLAASWFATAKTIDSSSNAPEWVARHLTRGTHTTKSITDLSALHKYDHPSVTFGSTAVAAGSKKGIAQIKFALKVREKKLAARLNLILSGYSNDVAQGIKVHRHHKKGNE